MIMPKIKPIIILYIILVLFNLASLYFIIVLFSYDEITGFLLNGEKKSMRTRGPAYLFYIATLLNLYYLFYTVIKKKFTDKP